MNPEQLQQALQNLRGLQEPAAISWWPLAIGWWGVILVSLLTLSYVIFRWMRYRRTNRYRNIAQIGLELSFEQWQETANTQQYLQSANALLKRCIRQISDSKDITSLLAKEWGSTLNQYAKNSLPESAIIALTLECYQADPQTDIDALHTQLMQWLATHSHDPNMAKYNVEAEDA